MDTRRIPVIAAAVVAAAVVSACGKAQQPSTPSQPNPAAEERDLSAVSPPLADYAERIVAGQLWTRPDLSPRDRSVVTVSALIARNQTVEFETEFRRALDNEVTPAELSEIITHLAFYAGWPNALGAVDAAAVVFDERGIAADELPVVDESLLPLDEAAENQRAAGVEQDYGTVAPGVLDYTTDVLFTDLWLRPGLVPRDRSLVTVSALVAAGQAGQVTFHLNRAMDNGLTQPEAAEVLTQLAFYAGWPSVFTALALFRDVFNSRTP